jgi:hypothetical protein
MENGPTVDRAASISTKERRFVKAAFAEGGAACAAAAAGDDGSEEVGVGTAEDAMRNARGGPGVAVRGGVIVPAEAGPCSGAIVRRYAVPAVWRKSSGLPGAA